MNYSRIFKFSIFQYVLVEFLSFLKTVISGGEIPEYTGMTYLLEVAAFSFVSFIIFIFLAYKQKEKPYIHAIYVASLTWAYSLSVSFALSLYFGYPLIPITFLFPFLFTLLEVFIGTAIGIKIRERQAVV